MNKKKFINRKLNPALANLVNTINSLSTFEINSQSLDLLKKEVEASAASLGEDGKLTKSDEELYERLINSVRDLKNLSLVLWGISRKIKISPGIKGFGEKIGDKYGLYMDRGSKFYLGVFSGLAKKISERIPQLSQRIWTYLLRFIYIVLFFLIGEFYVWVFLMVTYFTLYWAMVTSPPAILQWSTEKPIDVFHLSTPMRDEIAGAIESALLQDGNFNGKVDEIEAELQKIYSIINAGDLADARNVSLFITHWLDSDNYSNTIGELFYGSVTKIAEYLERFFSTGDIGELEFAKSELKPIENKLGYAYLKNASWAPITKLDFDSNGSDSFRAEYNNSVDLFVANHVNDFRQALEDGNYYLAAYYYGCDLTNTEQKQIQEHNEREAEEERRIAEAAQAQAAQAQAAQEQAVQTQPPEKGSGLFSSVGKNFVAGAMLGKGLSDTFISKPVDDKNKYYRCGWCGFETVERQRSCPKCKKYSKFIELQS